MKDKKPSKELKIILENMIKATEAKDRDKVKKLISEFSHNPEYNEELHHTKMMQMYDHIAQSCLVAIQHPEKYDDALDDVHKRYKELESIE